MAKLTSRQAWDQSHSALGHHLKTPDSKMTEAERQERLKNNKKN